MPRKHSPAQDDPEQVKRFIETAKALGVDQSEGAFEKAFKTVISPPKASPKDAS
jgi:hypothetical protein